MSSEHHSALPVSEVSYRSHDRRISGVPTWGVESPIWVTDGQHSCNLWNCGCAAPLLRWFLLCSSCLRVVSNQIHGLDGLLSNVYDARSDAWSLLPTANSSTGDYGLVTCQMFACINGTVLSLRTVEDNVLKFYDVRTISNGTFTASINNWFECVLETDQLLKALFRAFDLWIKMWTVDSLDLGYNWIQSSDWVCQRHLTFTGLFAWNKNPRPVSIATQRSLGQGDVHHRLTKIS